MFILTDTVPAVPDAVDHTLISKPKDIKKSVVVIDVIAQVVKEGADPEKIYNGITG